MKTLLSNIFFLGVFFLNQFLARPVTFHIPIALHFIIIRLENVHKPIASSIKVEMLCWGNTKKIFLLKNELEIRAKKNISFAVLFLRGRASPRRRSGSWASCWKPEPSIPIFSYSHRTLPRSLSPLH